MKSKIKKLNKTRERRKFRIRNKLFGTSEKPRLSVFRSSKQIYAQLIDDQNGETLAACGSLDKEFASNRSKKAAKDVGLSIAKKAQELKIDRAIFDKGRFKFHGIVALVAKGAREGGLQF